MVTLPRLLTIIILVRLLLVNQDAWASPTTPPFPVILIHGIYGGATTWESLADYLRNTHRWKDGGIITTTTVGASPADFYRLVFSDSFRLTFDQQASELSAIIDYI